MNLLKIIKKFKPRMNKFILSYKNLYFSMNYQKLKFYNNKYQKYLDLFRFIKMINKKNLQLYLWNQLILI